MTNYSSKPDETTFNESLRVRYEAGETIHQLAVSYGVSTFAIHRHLHAAGTKMRRRGAPRKKRVEDD